MDAGINYYSSVHYAGDKGIKGFSVLYTDKIYF